MATGKPVVASDISGYRTILEDGKQGYLVPPRQPEAIAQAIIKILTNPSLAKKLGEAGRAKALAYSWQNIALKVESYYKQLIAKRRYSFQSSKDSSATVTEVNEKKEVFGL